MSGLNRYKAYLAQTKNLRGNSKALKTNLPDKTYAEALNAMQAKECFARGIVDQELHHSIFYSQIEHADSKYSGANQITLHCDEICDTRFIRPILRSGTLGRGKVKQGMPKVEAKFSKKHSGALVSDTSGIYLDFYDVYFLHDDRRTKHKLTTNGEDKYTWCWHGGMTDTGNWFNPDRKNSAIAGNSTKEAIQKQLNPGKPVYNELLRGLSVDSLVGIGCVDKGIDNRLKLLQVYTREMTKGNAQRKAAKMATLPKLPLVLHKKGSVEEYTPRLIRQDLEAVLSAPDKQQTKKLKRVYNTLDYLNVNRSASDTKQMVDDFMTKFTDLTTTTIDTEIALNFV